MSNHGGLSILVRAWTILAMVAWSAVTHAESFESGCILPPALQGNHHPISDSCPRHGIAADAERRAQNEAKNNFCAPAPATRVTFYTLSRLQAKAAEAGAAPGALPSDRSVLEDLYRTSDGNWVGEGKQAVLVGYVVKAKGMGKETCNCSRSTAENVDIHIHVGPESDEELCKTVVVEMSPHFRPDGWRVAELHDTEGHPVRITGQLFYDSHHRLCNGSTPVAGQPPRYSLWEIHPVYQIEVCRNTSLGSCRYDDDSVWTALTEWQAPDMSADE